MEMVIFMGAQAAGKSSFYQFRFFDSHVRINLDMLRTRNRERILVEACLRAKQPFVVDNTNATKAQRRVFIELAKSHGFSVSGYYFQSIARDCLSRNGTRNRRTLPRVPSLAIRGTINRLEFPEWGEGFDRIQFVRISKGNFLVEDWQNEI